MHKLQSLNELGYHCLSLRTKSALTCQVNGDDKGEAEPFTNHSIYSRLFQNVRGMTWKNQIPTHLCGVNLPK